MSETIKLLNQLECADASAYVLPDQEFASLEVKEDKGKYQSDWYGGYRFVFKYDDQFPNMLHIWVRHRKTIEDAEEIWFEGTEEIYNKNFDRFETYTATEGIHWFWLKEDEVIMITSCFDR